MAKESLSQYLRNRLLLMGGILAGIFSMLMYTVYNWGLDDSTEYYLLQDALYVQSLLIDGQPLPVNTQSKQFYLGADKLPKIFSGLLGDPLEKKPYGVQYFTFQSTEYFIYGIQYLLNESSLGSNRLYILHQFYVNKDEEVPGISILQVSILTLSAVLLVMLLGAALIYLRVWKSMQALQLFSDEQCSNKALATKDNLQRSLSSMQFTEIQNFALQLQVALQEIQEQTQKERLFIQGLSHELRTPMAITSVALDLLSKKNLDDNTCEKLTKIRNANSSMISLANTLLSIWKNEKNLSPQDVLVSPLVKGIIKNLQSVYLKEGVYFNVEVADDLSLLASLEPLKIVLENLLRNAMQHGALAGIKVGANERSIWVENELPAVQACGVDESSFSQPLNDGYGLGLYIARQACNNQGWKLIVESGPLYRASIIFTS